MWHPAQMACWFSALNVTHSLLWDFVLVIRIWAQTKLHTLGLKGIVWAVFMWGSGPSKNRTVVPSYGLVQKELVVIQADTVLLIFSPRYFLSNSYSATD